MVEQPAAQNERERVNRFIETVNAIQAGRELGLTLSEYWPREIADAIQFLIDSDVRKEREACAVVAEDAADPSGAMARGQTFETDPVQRQICLEIAKRIRARANL